jgi:hypothetical protein
LFNNDDHISPLQVLFIISRGIRIATYKEKDVTIDIISLLTLIPLCSHGIRQKELRLMWEWREKKKPNRGGGGNEASGSEKHRKKGKSVRNIEQIEE